MDYIEYKFAYVSSAFLMYGKKQTRKLQVNYLRMTNLKKSFFIDSCYAVRAIEWTYPTIIVQSEKSRYVIRRGVHFPTLSDI